MSDAESIHARSRSRAVLPIESAGAGLVGHRVEVDPREVVFVKSIVEASEGLASIFAEHGGSLTIATTPSREPALLELLSDLERHCGARLLARGET